MEELYTEYPLPWVVDDSREGHEGLVTVFAANGRAVMCTGDMEVCSWADILNARLIAAAPDLLAACEAAVSAHDAITENEMDGYGGCKYCGADSYPVDEAGEKLASDDDQSQADEYRTDHDADCVSTILDTLSLQLRAAIAKARSS